MSINLQDFALARPDARLAQSTPGGSLESARTPSGCARFWTWIGRSPDKARFQNAKDQFCALVRQSYPPAIADRIAQQVRGIPASSPLLGSKAQELLGLAERARGAMQTAPGAWLEGAAGLAAIRDALEGAQDHRLVGGFPGVIDDRSRPALEKQVFDRVLRRPEFAAAKETPEFQGVLRRLIQEESGKVMQPRLTAGMQVHFALEHRAPPFASSDLSLREANLLVDAVVAGADAHKAVEAMVYLREKISAAVPAPTPAEQAKLMENMFDVHLISRLPVQLARDHFRAALDGELGRARALGVAMAASGLPSGDDPARGSAPFARGLLRLASQLPRVSAERLVAFGCATDPAVEDVLRHPGAYHDLAPNARALRPEMFAMYERADAAADRDGALMQFDRGVKALVRAPDPAGGEAGKVRAAPPAAPSIGVVMALNSALGAAEARGVIEIFREAAAMHERPAGVVTPDQQALQEAGQCAALLAKLDAVRPRLRDTPAADAVAALRASLLERQSSAGVQLKLKSPEGRALAGLPFAWNHGVEFAELMQPRPAGAPPIQGQFAALARKFQEDVVILDRYKAGQNRDGQPMAAGEPRGRVAPEAEGALHRMRISAEVLASGSPASGEYLHRMLANPEANQLAIRQFQGEMARVLTGRNWAAMPQGDRDALVNGVVAAMPRLIQKGEMLAAGSPAAVSFLGRMMADPERNAGGIAHFEAEVERGLAGRSWSALSVPERNALVDGIVTDMSRRLFNAQVVAYGSPSANEFLRDLMAAPDANPLGLRRFNAEMDKELAGKNWAAMGKPERDRLVDAAVARVRPHYVRATGTPAHLAAVQETLVLLSPGADEVDRGVARQFRSDIGRAQYRLDGAGLGPTTTRNAQSSEAAVEAVATRFGARYGADAPAMLVAVTALANQRVLVALPGTMAQARLPAHQYGGPVPDIRMDTREDRVVVSMSMDGAPRTVTRLSGGEMSIYSARRDGTADPAVMEGRQAVRFEVVRPAIPGGIPTTRPLAFSDELFIDESRARREM